MGTNGAFAVGNNTDNRLILSDVRSQAGGVREHVSLTASFKVQRLIRNLSINIESHDIVDSAGIIFQTTLTKPPVPPLQRRVFDFVKGGNRRKV